MPSERLRLLLSDRGLGITDPARCGWKDGRIVDSVSGRHAVAIDVRSVELDDPGKATAFGTFTLGGFWCGGGVYVLEFKLGKWEAVPQGDRVQC